MADRIGQQLGNYRLIRLLGCGGFAEVYLGEHTRLNTQAALKVLRGRLASNEEVESFQNEARTIARLVHPHIVRIFDFDVEQDVPFLVMDYAPHGTLRQRHPRGEISNGLLTGTVDIANHIQLTVQSAEGNAPLFLEGSVQSDGSLVGTCCSRGTNGQCSSQAGASGTWKVSKQ